MRKYKVHKFEIFHNYAHEKDTVFFEKMYKSIFGKEMAECILSVYKLEDIDIRVQRRVYVNENGEIHHTKDCIFTGLKNEMFDYIQYKKAYICSKNKLDLSKCYAVDTMLMPIYYEYIKNRKKYSKKEWSKRINKIKDDYTDELIWEEIKNCCAGSLINDIFANPNTIDVIMFEYKGDDISKLVGFDVVKGMGAKNEECMYLNFRTCTDGETSVTSRGISISSEYDDTMFEYADTVVHPAIDKLNIPRHMHQCDAWMNLIRIVREEIYPIKDKLKVNGNLNKGVYVSEILENEVITDDMRKRINENIEDTMAYMRNIIDGNQIFN